MSTPRTPRKRPAEKRPARTASSGSSSSTTERGTPRKRAPEKAARRKRPAGERRVRPIMRVKGATKAYSDLVALAPLDLAIAPGEQVALVGHNGSGKSTFLRLAAGLLELSEGSIEIGGEPVGTSPARAIVSFLPDEPVLYDDLSVREHLAYVAALHGADAPPEALDRLLDRVGLLARADDLPARFSRGLRQKTSIALGLVRPFKLLLIDEPFVGLDAPGRTSLLELLDEAHADGAAAVVATHDPTYVERVDRCVALRDGHVIHDGPATPDQVLELVGA
ncbi:MAG TPA: ABC transporter ATP-binding protein [Acidimicrobiales bacterium]|nr:ABC transporter ATP-binding protein [Acidimicrobiales bacterium]